MSCEHILLGGVRKGEKCGDKIARGNKKYCRRHKLVCGIPANKYYDMSSKVNKYAVLSQVPVLLKAIEYDPCEVRRLGRFTNITSTAAFKCECGRTATYTTKCACMCD